jgi:hypothetical protein
VLELDGAEVDIARFESVAGAGREALHRGNAERASELLAEALALWRGPALADLQGEPVVEADRARLDQLRLEATLDRNDAQLALGRSDDLVPQLEALVREHPYHERLRRQLILSLYRAGRQADALTAYRVARETLVGELGLEPSDALQQLERRILVHDPALDPPRPRDEDSPAPTEASEGTSRPVPRTRSSIWRVTPVAVVVVAAAAAAVAFAVHSPSKELPPPRLQPNSVGAVDSTTGRLVAAIPIGAGPSAIAAGANAVWVADYEAHTLLRIDPISAKVTNTIGLAGPPTGLAVGEGAVWVISATTQQVWRVDARYGNVAAAAILSDPAIAQRPDRAGPTAIAAGPGAVWVAYGTRFVARLDPVTLKVRRRVDVGDPPLNLALGDGFLWVVRGGEGKLLALDPRTLAIVQSVDAPWVTTNIDQTTHSLRGNEIAFTRGSLWVGGGSDDAVWHVDINRGRSVAGIPVGDWPVGVTLNAGRVWVATTGRTLAEIDPGTSAVTRTIHLSQRPIELARFGDRIWLTTL